MDYDTPLPKGVKAPAGSNVMTLLLSYRSHRLLRVFCIHATQTSSHNDVSSAHSWCTGLSLNFKGGLGFIFYFRDEVFTVSVDLPPVALPYSFDQW